MAGTNPRAARIAALIQRVVASSIERELHDKRLASITVTEVRVTNDLQIAKVYWTQLTDRQARPAGARSGQGSPAFSGGPQGWTAPDSAAPIRVR